MSANHDQLSATECHSVVVARQDCICGRNARPRFAGRIEAQELVQWAVVSCLAALNIELGVGLIVA